MKNEESSQNNTVTSNSGKKCYSMEGAHEEGSYSQKDPC